MYSREDEMDINHSGSLDLSVELSDLMLDKTFEQDLISAFTQKRYSLSNEAPEPFWTLCSVSFQMIRLFKSSEIIVIDENYFNTAKPCEMVDCCTGDSIIKLPKKYITIGS